MNPYLLTGTLSYLSGSIPFGFILVRLVRGEDIRKSGSGNIGATNVSRKSPALGILTLILDALKGLVPVLLARMWALHHWQPPLGISGLSDQAGMAKMMAHSPMQRAYVLASLAAFMAIVGHVFSVWLKFRGGKGVATGLGAWITLAPHGVFAMVMIFGVTVALFRYISLGSITAAAIFPLATWFLRDYHQTPAMVWFMAASSALIIVKHQKNIRRLLTGTESKFREKRA
jgi:acyl phosphate:glycerol-3-phosphate acyltransferase